MTPYLASFLIRQLQQLRLSQHQGGNIEQAILIVDSHNDRFIDVCPWTLQRKRLGLNNEVILQVLLQSATCEFRSRNEFGQRQTVDLRIRVRHR